MIRPIWWFVLNRDRPVFALDGIHARWKGASGPIKAPRYGEHDIYAFLTTTPNALVKPIHPNALPVMLTTREECELWMAAPWWEAKKLQRPVPEECITVLTPYTTVGGLGGLPPKTADLFACR